MKMRRRIQSSAPSACFAGICDRLCRQSCGGAAATSSVARLRSVRILSLSRFSRLEWLSTGSGRAAGPGSSTGTGSAGAPANDANAPPASDESECTAASAPACATAAISCGCGRASAFDAPLATTAGAGSAISCGSGRSVFDAPLATTAGAGSGGGGASAASMLARCFDARLSVPRFQDGAMDRSRLSCAPKALGGGGHCPCALCAQWPLHHYRDLQVRLSA